MSKTPTPPAPTAPPVIGPPPKDAAGLSDFQRQMDAALSQIVTDAPSGPVPAPTMRDDVPVVPRSGVNPADLRVDPEEAAMLAHRATLAGEEARLEARRLQNPMPTVGVVQGLVPSAWGASQSELVVREGADPLYVECFRTLRRLVAGGSPLLAMMDVPSLMKLIGTLREKIEYRAPDPAPVKAVVTG